MECVEREGEGRGLALVERSFNKQSEMNVQSEQIISTPTPFTACKHNFVPRASCVWSQNVGTTKQKEVHINF